MLGSGASGERGRSMFSDGNSAISRARGLEGCAGLRGWVYRWSKGEEGMSEVTSAIFVLPILTMLIFVLIETGVNLRYRSLVENITQVTTRSIQQDGGLYWVRLTTIPVGYTGAAGSFTWTKWGTNELQALCGTNRCTKPPTMTCTVSPPVVNLPGFAVDVAQNKGTPVVCKAVFYYKPVSPLSQNPVTSLGFSGFLTQPITADVKGWTTVGIAGGGG